ncbi:3-oxoacyl-[acyl-carrier-protein] synthase 3 A, chloroplastic-like isoform X2 [Olea europaea var. sylvestris]|uniref:3-oxoacyl-[acyl-carrier-protein] synthase 3 A, chloroplastic-like isoform X2 n=1 Tax=Olea europaea var. sylvestris TaxID=158386 RepID=UPI000C1CCCFC|nr:3-oxoacyl-[acyl-carrier-protein] synthase 3 A, chloroplastic-like isoform X2 [Olea europaea var. sylvestris]XP_022886127.1 3-oxoacyl-[acyl-carrier-protein] synthase 3 A, chloroplastic-like isoform X2 [Olea europaea var. sylvestris]XP_022886128.1 3-oxoacyl-[acyl-carrier-protein] synthase 3 A, chloroplastic-like isoform X2 [Olea europaea var. sylvestris]
MANASGLYTATLPTVRRRFTPSTGIYRSGFWFSEGVSKRIMCSSTVEGADKLSSSESRVPRLVSRGCKLVGCGSAVPGLQISNDDLSKIVDTNDEWISVRTGIRNRRVLSGKDSLTSLAAEAAKKALEMAEVDPDDVDLVLMCTSTPEDLFGSAPQIQKTLGCKNNPLAYDITAACSGFVLGLVSAACYIRGGGFKNVLVIGADALSRYVDWTDRGSCILFGDGAGAVLVQACDCEDDGLFAFDLHSDGEGQRHLRATIMQNEVDHVLGTNGSAVGFPPKNSSYSCIQMNGKEVFRFAVRVVPQSIEYALEKAGLTSSNIDWLLLHQANQRIIDAVATRLEVPSERVLSNLANYGNTSAASIPLALDEAVRSGKVQAGHTIAAAGFGAGLTWGSAIVRWG